MDDRSSKPGKGNRSEKRGKGTRDVNEVAFSIVQQATGQAPKPELEPEKIPYAISLSNLGKKHSPRKRS